MGCGCEGACVTLGCGADRIRKVLRNFAAEERRRASASRGVLLQGSGGSSFGVGVPPGAFVPESPSGITACDGMGDADLVSVEFGVEALIVELNGVGRERERKRLLEVFAGEHMGEVVIDRIGSDAQQDVPAELQAEGCGSASGSKDGAQTAGRGRS